MFGIKEPAKDFELPTVAGDVITLEAGKSKFSVTCVGAGGWRVSKVGDPLYSGELRQIGMMLEYEARSGAMHISMASSSLRVWAGNL